MVIIELTFFKCIYLLIPDSGRYLRLYALGFLMNFFTIIILILQTFFLSFDCILLHDIGPGCMATIFSNLSTQIRGSLKVLFSKLVLFPPGSVFLFSLTFLFSDSGSLQMPAAPWVSVHIYERTGLAHVGFLCRCTRIHILLSL